ncbi:MAG: type II secretion system F family protein [Acidimicrobiia bacterium]|nr:type II secretion system F family protein [Acidimicrobiia bacterium]
MIRLLAAAAMLFFVGITLVLSEFRLFRSQSLANRVGPYLPGGRASTNKELLSLESFGQLLRPLAEASGSLAARVFGVSEELPRRLRRVHWDIDSSGFRVRQIGWALATCAVVTVIGLVVGLPAALLGLFALVGPLLAFLVVEQQLANASDRWKERTFQELPVIAEQIAMLLGSGYSLGAALQRVSARGSGVISQDLETVVQRIQQGTSENAALREWAEIVDVEAVSRVVSILSLNKEAGDLGSMVAAEARTIRAEAHRALLESIEKKNQQVWIPVTIAALVPGVILMMIPFISALSEF